MLKKLLAGSVTLLMAMMPLARAAAATPTNLVSNPSVETEVSAGVPAGWTSSSWGNNNPVFSYENTGHTGSHSLKTTMSARTDGDAKWYFANIDVTPNTTYTYSHWYMSDVDTQIDAEVTNTGGAFTYHLLGSTPASPGTWTKAEFQFTAPATATSITIFQAIYAVGYVQIDDASLTPYTPAALDQGMVSVTFDDGWLTHYTEAMPLLDQNGMKGTFYVLTGAFDFDGYMNTTQLKALFDGGHEIGAHTIDHLSLPTLTQDEALRQLTESKTTLQGLLGPTAAINFASPYGEYNDLTIDLVLQNYRSQRSTDEGFNSKDNFSVRNIRVQNVLDGTTPAQVAAWVDLAKAQKTWLVLVYHQVQADPSTAEDYSVTPANLQTELQYIKTSGIAVKTVQEALDIITGAVTPPAPTKAGDVNGDNSVNALDLSIIATNWNMTGKTFAEGDLNNDGAVNALDLSILATNWGK